MNNLQSTPLMGGVRCGDFTVTGGNLNQDYQFENHTLTVLSGANIQISGKTSQDKLVVKSGVTANITLQNANIEFSDGVEEPHTTTPGTCAFDMAGATVSLTLLGHNTLKSGLCRAGLHVPKNANLTITSASTGDLTATCIEWGAAGIGGNRREAGGSITIEGGTVEANGIGGSAGIGGGAGGAGGTCCIRGNAKVSATGAHGAGIGGGQGHGSGNITIGGNAAVTAKGGSINAGIGSHSKYRAVITIEENAVIAANGGNEGTGISGGVIVIRGNTVVSANGGNGCAGISGDVIVIRGHAVVSAIGGNEGAGIFSSSVMIRENVVITANGGKGGAGIGGDTIAISGGTVTATGGGVDVKSDDRRAVSKGGAGIGGCGGKPGGTVTIFNAVVYATAGTPSAASIGYGAGGELMGYFEIENSLLIKCNTGTVFGSAVVTSDFTIESGVYVKIGQYDRLTVNSGVTLTNNGHIINGGTIENNGVIINLREFQDNGVTHNNGRIEGLPPVEQPPIC